MSASHTDISSASRSNPSARSPFAFALLALFAACSGSGSGGNSPVFVGDLLPPRLTAAVQNRAVDPQGATIDLVFDEPMDAASVEDVAHYTASNGALPLWAALLANGMQLRVSFDAAVLPGVTTLEVDGVLDLAGNPSAPVAYFPITSDDLEPPLVVTAAATALPGASNDSIELAFDDDLVPEDATDLSRFYFEHPLGTFVQLDDASIEYEPERRTIVITFPCDDLDGIHLQTGVAWSLSIDELRDLGGNELAPGADMTGIVTGDSDAPVILGTTQNLGVDPGGHVVDVSFSEMLGADFADAMAVWTASSGQSILDATLLWPGDVVRLRFDGALVPGDDTLALENVFDLAGNQLVAVPAQEITPADVMAPTILAATATAVSGFENDVLTCRFSEPVMLSDATDLAKFSLFQGTEVDLAGSIISYDAGLRTVTITLVEVDLATGSICALLCDSVRDIAGNPVAAGSGQFVVVAGDSVAPTTVTAQQNTLFDPFGYTIDIAFDEPVVLDPAPTFTASGGITPIASQVIGDSTGIRLVFAVQLVPGSSAIQIAGLRDPAGNAASTATTAITSTDVTGPSLSAASATTLSGVANDRVIATFDQQVSGSEAVDASHWTLESPIGTAVPLASAAFVHDPATRTVTMTLPLNADLTTGATFLLVANDIHDVSGNPLGATPSVSGTVTGDSTIPTVVVADRNQTADPGNRTVDVTFSEAVTAATSQIAANFDVSGTPNTQSATLLLDGRTVRLYTTAAITPGTTTIAISNVRDLASNLMATVASVAIAN